MAAAGIDEAVRNLVAVGARPDRIAILDNFCWGNCEKPDRLGSLVLAAKACYDVAMAYGTPFVSGKDSLNNEFRHPAADGATKTIAVPPSLLISALGQIDDVAQAVTMDLKEPGNWLYQVGMTKDEMGGSHYALVRGIAGGRVPKVDPAIAKRTFAALHAAMATGLVRACHDLSEGGLAVAAAEMAFAGELGARLSLARVPFELSAPVTDAALLFSESNTRFLCEVRPDAAQRFEALLASVPCARLGEVTAGKRLEIFGLATAAADAPTVVAAELSVLKKAWQEPLRW
jgi:phosphoribosylformylglycinamidine synthase